MIYGNHGHNEVDAVCATHRQRYGVIGYSSFVEYGVREKNNLKANIMIKIHVKHTFYFYIRVCSGIIHARTQCLCNHNILLSVGTERERRAPRDVRTALMPESCWMTCSAHATSSGRQTSGSRSSSSMVHAVFVSTSGLFSVSISSTSA